MAFATWDSMNLCVVLSFIERRKKKEERRNKKQERRRKKKKERRKKKEERRKKKEERRNKKQETRNKILRPNSLTLNSRPNLEQRFRISETLPILLISSNPSFFVFLLHQSKLNVFFSIDFTATCHFENASGRFSHYCPLTLSPTITKKKIELNLSD